VGKRNSLRRLRSFFSKKETNMEKREDGEQNIKKVRRGRRRKGKRCLICPSKGIRAKKKRREGMLFREREGGGKGKGKTRVSIRGKKGGKKEKRV